MASNSANNSNKPLSALDRTVKPTYDETVEIPNAEELESPATSPTSKKKTLYRTPFEDGETKKVMGSDEDLSDKPLEPGTSTGISSTRHDLAKLKSTQSMENSEDTNSEDEDDDEDDDLQTVVVEGAYNPSDYEHLPVSSEVKDLFQFISRYTSQVVDLDCKLRPFVPEYIPAVGDIDAFIKVPRPDGKEDTVGLVVLDEPCAKQSDPSVLDLHLRAVAKQTSARSVVVKKVENADKNIKVVEKWIRDISDLHRSKPPPTVHYNKPMPDIDNLMQEWPDEFEDLLKEITLPTGDINCDLATYVDIIAALVDIPVYKSRVQTLHVVFTLYSAFKNINHFREMVEEPNSDAEVKEQSSSSILEP